jgi:cell division protein FtsB
MFFYLLIIYTALTHSIVGERGFLVNINLEKQVNAERQQVSSQQVILENAKKRLDTIWSEEALLDRARSLGYVQQQDEVYYFSQEMENDTKTVNTENHQQKLKQSWLGLSLLWSFLIAIIPTGISLFGYILLRRYRSTQKEKTLDYPHLHQ